MKRTVDDEIVYKHRRQIECEYAHDHLIPTLWCWLKAICVPGEQAALTMGIRKIIYLIGTCSSKLFNRLNRLDTQNSLVRIQCVVYFIPYYTLKDNYIPFIYIILRIHLKYLCMWYHVISLFSTYQANNWGGSVIDKMMIKRSDEREWMKKRKKRKWCGLVWLPIAWLSIWISVKMKINTTNT